MILRISTVVLAALLVLPATAVAQRGRAVLQERSVLEESRVERDAAPLEASDARRVREEFQELLAQHPPTLLRVLQTDPSLMSRADYLAPYPRIEAFIKLHPEVVRDPAYFLGQPFGQLPFRRTPQEQAFELLENMLIGLLVVSGVVAALFVLGSLVRQAINHRRWLRQSRIQTEAHSKILDRLQSNEDLLAYIQSPVGQRFLQQNGPVASTDPEPRAVGAPISRILWSAQAGVMLMALGIGFWIVQRNVLTEIAPAFNAMGVIATALGLGAICSGGLSYLLSARFGLLDRQKEKGLDG